MSNPYDPQNPNQGEQPSPYGAPIPSGGGGGYGGGYGTPYGQQNPYGNDMPKKTDAVSITGFVLSLTCCLSLVGAILGGIGLKRTKGGQRKGRWAAISALVVGILGTLAFAGIIVAIVIFARSVVGLDEAEQGTCVNVDDSGSENVVLTEKECSEDHDGEIVYVGEAGADAGRLETDEAIAVCEERVRADNPDVAAVLDQGPGRYGVGFLAEDPDNVSSGDRVICYVDLTSGDKLSDRLAP